MKIQIGLEGSCPNEFKAQAQKCDDGKPWVHFSSLRRSGDKSFVPQSKTVKWTKSLLL